VDQWLIRLEVALQIYFSQNKSSEITYDKFCELVPKLDLDRERVVAGVGDSIVHNNNNGNSNHPDLLAEPSERLWHDFICVTEPVLYTWNEPSASLNRVIADGKRPHHLKRLLTTARENGISRATSNRMVAFFLAMKDAATTTPQPSGNPQQEQERYTLFPTKSSPNKPTTQVSSLKELEDRIRAKAHDRQRHLDRAERAKPQTQQDERVTMADALVSHARQVLRQRQRGIGTNSRFRTKAQSEATKKTLLDDDHPSTKCRISFQSLVEALPSYTRPHLSQTIEQLAEQCPNWISWSVTGESSSGTSKDGVIIPKTAIITMETANYKNTRAQLLGIHDQVAEDQSPRRRFGLASAPERTPPPHPTAIVPAVTVSGSKRSLSNSGMGALKPRKRVREGL
jgi:hypothetical protein